MKFIALKELPQGQQPGDIFEAHEDVGRVFEQVGAAKRVTETDETPTPQPPSRSRRYQRRDLAAEA